LDISFVKQTMASDVFRKAAETLAAKGLLIAIGLLTSVVVARILGPEGRGFYAVATAVAAFGIQFGNAGLHASNSYHVAKDRSLLGPLLGNTMAASLAFGGGISVLSLAVFQFRPDLAPLPKGLLILSLAWIPFGLAFMLLQNLMIGIQDIRAYNIVEVMNRVLSIAFVAILIAAGAVTAESVYVAGFIALLASIFWIFRRLRRAIAHPPVLSLPMFLGNLRYGLKAYLAALFAFMVLRIDLLMVKYIRGADEAGYYSIAVSMVDLIYLIPATIGTIVFPKLSAMGTDAEKWEYARKMSLYLGVVLAVVVAVAIPLAPILISLLYGKAFLPAAPSFAILGVGVVFYGLNNLYSNCLAAMSFPWFAVWIWVAMAALNVLLNMYLIPRMGIVGASLSSLVCYLALMLSQYAYLARKGGRFAGQA